MRRASPVPFSTVACPSGRRSTPRKRVRCKPPWVQIPPPPPWGLYQTEGLGFTKLPAHLGFLDVRGVSCCRGADWAPGGACGRPVRTRDWPDRAGSSPCAHDEWPVTSVGTGCWCGCVCCTTRRSASAGCGSGSRRRYRSLPWLIVGIGDAHRCGAATGSFRPGAKEPGTATTRSRPDSLAAYIALSARATRASTD